ncbi:MAG: ABC transporter substrate-binding protein [Acidobacteriota bacterium]
MTRAKAIEIGNQFIELIPDFNYLHFAAVTLLLIGLSACVPAPRTDGMLVIAMANGPANLDPGVGLDEASQKLHTLLFSSLLKIDESLRVVPDLAIRFETPDPKTYIAEVRHGVHFHDGRELTADDVAYTYRRFIDPKFTSGRKGAYKMIASVDVVDRYTVAFHLREPSGSFPVNLVMGIVPAGTGADAARHPIGSGPYKIAEFVADDHVTLTAFPDYFEGAPNNAGLIFRVVPDDTMRGLELRKGTVDIIVNDLAPDIVHALRSDPRLGVTTTVGTDYAYLGFNMRDPLLQSVKLRQAVGFAIDRQAIVDYLRRGLALPAIGIIPPMSWAFEPNVFQFTHDIAKAKALLDEAGYPDPDGDGPLPRLRLSLKTSTAEVYRLQAAVIQRNLADVGIAVDVRSYEFATLFADVLKGNVQLYTLQWVGVTDPDMLRRVFHSTQTPPAGFNRGFYKNAEVDRLIDAASIAPDDATRKQLYGDVQRIIASDAPYVSLWTKTNVAVFQSALRGVHLSPIAEFTFLKDVAR